MIARYAPGMGNPWKLPIDDWYGLIGAVARMMERERPSSTDPLEAAKDYMKRYKSD
jgi:hypothetical protein